MRSIDKTIQITDEEIKNFKKELLLSKTNLKRNLVKILLILICIKWVAEEWINIGIILLLVLSIIFFLVDPIRYLVWIKFKKKNNICRNVNCIINRESITYSVLDGKVTIIKFEDVIRIFLLNNNIVVVDKNNQTIFLPKLCFEKEELEIIEEIINENVSIKKIYK